MTQLSVGAAWSGVRELITMSIPFLSHPAGLRIVAALCAWSCATQVLADPRSSADVGSSDAWIRAAVKEAREIQVESTTRCGIHALYVLLRVLGHPVSYADVGSAVDVSERGTTLEQLRSAAISLGVDAGAYHCTLDDLREWNYSGVLVLIHNLGADNVTQALSDGRVEVGHYITLVGYDSKNDRILGVDGSFATVRRFSRERFLDMWTGYALVPADVAHDAPVPGLLLWTTPAGLVALIWYASMPWRGFARTTRNTRAAKAVANGSGSIGHENLRECAHAEGV
jgi:hypothetical protein